MSKVISNDKLYDTQGGMMFSSEGNFQQNPDGTWSEAIPLPHYGWLKMRCHCGKKFKTESEYRTHYQRQHTNRKFYKRTPTGMVEL